MISAARKGRRQVGLFRQDSHDSTVGDQLADFTQLRVWQAARAIAVDSYRLTNGFPAAERFGITSQIRRAAVSIAANIAESTGRFSFADQARFLQMAKGSVKELRCELIIARDLGFMPALDQGDLERRLDQIDRMLSAMLRHLRSTISVSGPRSPVQQ
jgi:four helix bundle protein